MTITNSRRVLVLLTVCLLLLLTAGVAVYAVAAKDDGAGATEDGAAATTTEEAAVDTTAEETTRANEAHAKAAIDPKDDGQVVGFSSDVFFGRVVERAGSEGAPTTKPGAEVPMTQYTVEVTEVIKGDASGRVLVNQLGGYVDDGHEDHEHLDLLDGDPLLEPGQEYLFATNYVPEESWYQIVSNGAGDVKVADKAQRQELKEKFEKAKANEVKPKSLREEMSDEEKAARDYTPCLPDGSNPRGKEWEDLPCDPSDPLPPGSKSDPSSGRSKSSGQSE